MALTLIVAGCGRDAQLRVSEARLRYAVRPGGFVVHDLPATASEPARQIVVLEVVVRRLSQPKLAGLTLDVSLRDARGREKDHRRVWVDTSRIPNDGEEKHDLRLEGVSFAPGDRFRVEIRHPVPVAERGNYREFATSS